MTDEFMQYADHLKNEKLFELEEFYQKQLEIYRPDIQKNFNRICTTIVNLQKKQLLGAISYLEYTLLFTNLIRAEETAEVRVYDKNWYFDPNQLIVGSFDFSFLFTKYRELKESLMSARKRFAGAVTAQETTAYLLTCASQFYKYVVSSFRFSILPCVRSEPFLSIQRADEFEINIGEYMGHTEAVYKENRTRTSKETLDWFDMREEFDYAFEDFSGLDFSGADLSEIDLRYADLSNTTLTNTDFQDAMLFGTRFCHANLQNADLRYCQMHEADFTGADLTNACFTAASAYRGVPNHAEWIITGYRSLSFRDANLTNADFSRCDIHDADFTGAVMDGTIIERNRLDQFALSAKQLKTITITDADPDLEAARKGV